MTLRISGKHMDIGDAFRTRIGDRLNEAVDKYFDGNFSGTVVVSKNGSRFSTDCVVHLDTGVVFQAAGQAHEPDVSFAEAAERIEKRLRRYKRRLKDHKASSTEHRDMAYSVMAAIPEEEEELPEDFSPAIIAETTLKVGTLSVAGAVMELDRQDSPVVVFRNAKSGDLNLVFRRADGNYGWVDPSTYAERA
ncbi:MAG: ribosome-associated translation inhibitor RaiA [Aurantimonas coralicida]|jgi:ribosomal subunit interface protein|uniref:ribosome hibernation-promoting factor, HPF/YfiA family n=1 Tax=Aurantimonas TaxID=182269 RepID=UPI0004626A36|nr:MULTISPECIES: ribosome-associated translation inhibitor RaiA [Aurantimonas]MAY27835.1 ribosomal subunit interface protein [Aurantimonas sp.]MCW7544757.1 ribosome-associated translation inhibitor RaiA [Aurantimonas litoralis]MBC6715297.1 ribosome-associated translation inhibitor RaiA [Aurantimonas sp. DM33-3]MCC4296707.1 ribosome-associated translation inhibitor RaiA [Aurantimonas coralicida]MCD1644999.1 ribosome-associated translation inhibitor RaiA [Aurantimonas coralicida]|tara:strand:- start:703 stop:1278 length:576 start_codon:yes stop_codon:yes gene_type:complete|eukprot:TRINITY_DN12064_c0_g1_i1.p1 TRINITY_DN12064_c0_g1~~TRINITY_DN12064_c0_g1_i1.p1  ORF type:complete len:192 (+),score=58.53 TRINITY_DN12064_c0_g1_i1:394-969(+)